MTSAATYAVQPRVATAGDYFALLKPRVMSLVIFTGVAGLLVAPGSIDPLTAFTALLCIAVGAGASGALNMAYDSDIDAVMARTVARPIPRGAIAREEALAFGWALSVGSVAFMGLFVNYLAAALLAFEAASDAEPANRSFGLEGLGEVLTARGRIPEAERALKEALALRQAAHDQPFGLAWSQAPLGRLLCDRGAPAEGMPLVEAALKSRSSEARPDDVLVAQTRVALGRCLVAAGRFEEAQTALASAYPVLAAQSKFGSDLQIPVGPPGFGQLCRQIIGHRPPAEAVP